MLTDIEEPMAFDRTPLTAAVAVAVGPRTPFSPERTFVTLPRGNPEIEPLAGAFERQGATTMTLLLMLQIRNYCLTKLHRLDQISFDRI